MEADYESAFYAPAGYRDADLEMAALEDLGNRHARRYAGFSADEVSRLGMGETLTAIRLYGPKDARKRYSLSVRSRDEDEVGPCLEWSLDHRVWKSTPREARTDWSGRTGCIPLEVTP